MVESEVFNYAIKHYSNPSCKTAEEFTKDYNIAVTIKRLLNKRAKGEDVNLRLVLNCFISMYNVFEPQAANVILYHRMGEDHYSSVKTIGTFLNLMPDDIPMLNIDVRLIEFDQELVDFLRGI